METDKINLGYVHANIPLAAVCVYKSILWRECGVNHPLRECTALASVNNNLAKRLFLLQRQHKQRENGLLDRQETKESSVVLPLARVLSSNNRKIIQRCCSLTYETIFGEENPIVIVSRAR